MARAGQASAADQSIAAGQYAASAHSDIVDLATLNVLPGLIPGGGQLATVKVGHSKATADSAAAQKATAESANLDAALLGQGIPVDAVTATAPPSTGPTTRILVAAAAGAAGRHRADQRLGPGDRTATARARRP